MADLIPIIKSVGDKLRQGHRLTANDLIEDLKKLPWESPLDDIFFLVLARTILDSQLRLCNVSGSKVGFEEK